jgi:hypothetical protein
MEVNTPDIMVRAGCNFNTTCSIGAPKGRQLQHPTNAKLKKRTHVL